MCFFLTTRPNNVKANKANVVGSGTLVGPALAAGTAESKLLESEKLIFSVFQASA